MRRLIPAALILALVLATSASASESESEHHYTGEHAASSRTVSDMQLALAFWSNRGVDANSICPSGVSVREAPDLNDGRVGLDKVLGRGAGCQLWIIDDIDVWKDPAERCTVVVHEVRHALGMLGHTPTGIMSTFIGEHRRDLPWECRRAHPIQRASAKPTRFLSRR